MDCKRFVVIEEDGITIYDESDDYDPAEEFIEDNDNIDELDVDYLIRATQLQEERRSAEKVKNCIVSFGIVALVVIYVTILCAMFY